MTNINFYRKQDDSCVNSFTSLILSWTPFFFGEIIGGRTSLYYSDNKKEGFLSIVLYLIYVHSILDYWLQIMFIVSE